MDYDLLNECTEFIEHNKRDDDLKEKWRISRELNRWEWYADYSTLLTVTEVDEVIREFLIVNIYDSLMFPDERLPQEQELLLQYYHYFMTNYHRK